MDKKTAKNIPVLQYLKEPVKKLNDLYIRYPLGGEYGWFVFVQEKQAFVYWNVDTRKWTLVAGSPLAQIEIDDVIGLTNEFDKYVPLTGNTSANPITGDLNLKSGTKINSSGNLIIGAESNLRVGLNANSYLSIGEENIRLSAPQSVVIADEYNDGKIEVNAAKISAMALSIDLHAGEGKASVEIDGNIRANANTGSFIVSAAGNVELSPANNIYLNPSGKAYYNNYELVTVNNAIINGGQSQAITIGSNNYTTQLIGPYNSKVEINSGGTTVFGAGNAYIISNGNVNLSPTYNVNLSPTSGKAYYKGNEIATVNGVVLNGTQSGTVTLGSNNNNSTKILGAYNSNIELSSGNIQLNASSGSLNVSASGNAEFSIGNNVYLTPVGKAYYKGYEITTVNSAVIKGGQAGDVRMGSNNAMTYIGGMDGTGEVVIDANVLEMKGDLVQMISDKDAVVEVNDSVAKMSSGGGYAEIDGTVNIYASGGANIGVTNQIDLNTPIGRTARYNGKEIATIKEYSNSEKIVGTWFGLTLYERTISIGALPNATAKSVSLGLSSSYSIRQYNTISRRPGISDFISIPYSNTVPGYDVQVAIRIQNGSAYVYSNYDLSNYTETYITIQYTK